MRVFTTLAILISASAIPASTASADRDDSSSLYRAACAYHAAVHKFACVSRFDQRMVNQLDEAASALCRAARPPARMDQLVLAWQDIKYLHRRIERILFDPARPFDQTIAEHWQWVDIGGARLSTQMVIRFAPHVRYPSYRPNRHPVPTQPSVVPVQPRNSWGFETYRQPFGRPAPPQGNRAPAEATRRNTGNAVIGAMLTRRQN